VSPSMKSRARLSARERVVGSRRCAPPGGGSRSHSKSERRDLYIVARWPAGSGGKRLPAVAIIRTPAARSGRASLFAFRKGQLRRAVGAICRLASCRIEPRNHSLNQIADRPPVRSVPPCRCPLHAQTVACERDGCLPSGRWNR
jgi:hypothetical protein